MEPLNYCRQIVQHLNTGKKRGRIGGGDEIPEQRIKDAIRLFPKFILGEEDDVYIDEDLKNIDEGSLPRLPFRGCALEFVPKGYFYFKKAVVFAFESPDSDRIAFFVACYDKKSDMWAYSAWASFNSRSFINRARKEFGFTTDENDLDEYGREIYFMAARVLLNFLNILQCSNVTTETIAPRKQPKKAMRGDALPFDTYHVLKVSTHSERAGANHQGGTHRSPREHLRRGHIRRLQDGRRIWVNAAVICAGVGGRVQKDYALVA